MEKVLVRNAADAEQVKGAEKKEAFGRDKELQDMKKVLETDFGRRVLKKILDSSRLHQTSFSESAHHMAFLEGQRNIGLMLLADITAADAAAYVKLMEEGKEK